MRDGHKKHKKARKGRSWFFLCSFVFFVAISCRNRRLELERPAISYGKGIPSTKWRFLVLLSLVAVYPFVRPSTAEEKTTEGKQCAFIATEHVLKTMPLSARCEKTGRVAYIESDGKRIVVFDKEGEVELIVDPAAKLDMPEYRYSKKQRICTWVDFDRDGLLRWSYCSSQFGYVDVDAKYVRFSGQD